MNFELNENQVMIAQMVKDLGDKEIRPHLMEWDEAQTLPIELLKGKMGPLGLLGILIPEEYGGAGFGYAEYVTAVSEIGKICGSVGLSVAAHNSLCSGHINQFANEEQKKKW